MAKKSKNWIQGAIKKPGSFKKAADNAGESTGEYAEDVLDNPESSTTMKRRAALAQTLSKLRK